VLLQNQQLILLVGGAVVIVFGVMSLLGKGFSGVSQMGGTDYGTTLPGSYLFGLTFAVGWTSCVGPILGVVLTLAAQTTSVWRGIMLLFIYSMGLGLPLMVVSTIFGQVSRKSLFWRVLKGKGWEWNTSLFVVAFVWALAIWRVLVAFTEYAFRNFAMFEGQTFTAIHEYGLLAIAILGAILWVVTSPGERRATVHLHSTQLISGALFILIGLLMLDGRLSYFSTLISPEFAERLATWEDWLVGLVSQ
jgi:cytochrome c biogenesis protein CcdA